MMQMMRKLEAKMEDMREEFEGELKETNEIMHGLKVSLAQTKEALETSTAEATQRTNDLHRYVKGSAQRRMGGCINVEFEKNQKFQTMVHALDIGVKHEADEILWFYAKNDRCSEFVKQGILENSPDGIIFTKRYPGTTEVNDHKVFSDSLKNTAAEAGGNDKDYYSSIPPNESVLFVTLPKSALRSVPEYPKDSELLLISKELLHAMGPNYSETVDTECLVLQNSTVEESVEASYQQSSLKPWIPGPDLYHHPDNSTTEEFFALIQKFESTCKKKGLILLYHFTDPANLPSIIQNGFRMAHAGQGGVYFSTIRGPIYYGFGGRDRHWKKRIIVDCFGEERMKQYADTSKLDSVIAYGCHPSICEEMSDLI